MSALSLKIKGGARLNRKLKEIADKLGHGHSVKVGFLEGAKYPDGLAVAQAAFWNEFGTSTAPARAFFRTMVDTKSPRWGDALAKIAHNVNYDSRQTMALMGEGIKGQLQHSINEWKDPPLSKFTIAKKGHSKPLIDTATMLRAVDYEVVEGA